MVKMTNVLTSLKIQFFLLRTAYRRDGLWYVIRTGIKYVAQWLLNVLTAVYYRHSSRAKHLFIFQGQTYNYFYHSYNTTWKNERQVEVPIIWDLVQNSKGKKVMEIGNVLRYYFPCRHDVIDLYENYPGIVNQDIATFHPVDKYDLVVSISTFEHIGCNENEPNDPGKFLMAIKNVIENVLAPGGEFILTLPLGQNPDMERYLATGKIDFMRLSCLKQIDVKTNAWEELPLSEIRDREFNSEGRWYGAGITLLIGITHSPLPCR